MTNEETIPEQVDAETHVDEVAEAKAAVARYWRPAVVGLCIVAIAGSAYTFYRNSTQSRLHEASIELGNAESVLDLQDVLEAYPNTPSAPSAVIRLAKEYYDTLNFAKAEETYNQFLDKYPQHLWTPVALLGLVHCREAKGDFAQALSGYDAFLKGRDEHYLAPQAVLGKARCQEELGQLEEARATCEDFIAAHDDSAWTDAVETRRQELELKIKRWQGTL